MTILRDQPDLAYEATKRLCRLGAQLAAVQLLAQTYDLAPVNLGQVWVEPRRWRRRARDRGGKLNFACFEGQQLVLHRRRAQSVLDGLDNPSDLAPDTLELSTPRGIFPLAAGIETVDLPMELRGELLHELGLHQMCAEAAQDTRFDHFTPNGQPIAAGTAVARAGTAIDVGAGHGESAAADAASEEP